MLLRVFWFCSGVWLVVVGLSRPMPTPFPVLRRLGALACGLFFIYMSLMYYFPKNRRKRAELKKLMDDLERELEHSDGDRRA